MPFQANEDFNIGPASGDRFTLNIQPVIPISINKDWNLILRTILPVISQTDVFGKSGTQSGLGNTTQSFFLSPKAPGPGGLIWGLGPVGYYPTATDSLLGPEKWGLGPTFVGLVQKGRWTIGILANQIWSLGGDPNEANISATYLQPFIDYTTKTHTTFGVDMEATYDWVDDQWTMPFNLFASQILKIGKQPVSIQFGVRYYAISPGGGPTGAFALTSPSSFRLRNPSRELSLEHPANRINTHDDEEKYESHLQTKRRPCAKAPFGFEATGGPSTARRFHTATLLPNRIFNWLAISISELANAANGGGGKNKRRMRSPLEVEGHAKLWAIDQPRRKNKLTKEYER